MRDISADTTVTQDAHNGKEEEEKVSRRKKERKQCLLNHPHTVLSFTCPESSGIFEATYY